MNNEFKPDWPENHHSFNEISKTANILRLSSDHLKRLQRSNEELRAFIQKTRKYLDDLKALK